MKKYYIVNNNQKEGPYTINELKNIGIKATTLVWTEGLENWVEAQNIEELKGIIKTVTPPPIPEEYLEQEPTINVKLGIAKSKKTKKKKSKEERKVKIAKEIKAIWKLFKISILIGLLSYPIYSYKGYVALYLKKQYSDAAYEIVDNYKIKRVKSQISKLVSDDKRHSLGHYYNLGGGLLEFRLNYPLVLNYYSSYITNKIPWSIFTMFIAFVLLVVTRYIKKGIEWISFYSKKDVT